VSRPGRPRTEQLGLVERVLDVLLREPAASSRRLQLLVGARTCDVLRALRLLLQEVARTPESGSQSLSRPQNGSPGSEVDP
jgi:hypothetical protein